MTQAPGAGVAAAAEAWLDEALRSGFTHITDEGLHWLWVDDAPEVDGWPSYLEACNYLHELGVPIAGGSGIVRFQGSDRVAYTRQVSIPWEYLGNLFQASSYLREALAKALSGADA